MKENILKNGVKEKYGNYLNATYSLIGDNSTSFNMGDVYADIDGWNLYYNIKSNVDTNLFDIFETFYLGTSTRNYTNRFTSFVNIMNDVSDEFNPNLMSFEGVVEHFTDVGRGWQTIVNLDITPTDAEEKEIAAGFVKWINDQAKLERVPITSDTYKINEEKKLIYVQPKTSINDFISNVNGIKDTFVTDGSVSYPGNVYTGLQVDEYIVCVLGDVTGDGLAKMNDVMLISEFIVTGNGLPNEINTQSADVNFDGKIRMNDVMKISKYIVEGGAL